MALLLGLLGCGREPQPVTIAHARYPISAMALSPDGRWLACGESLVDSRPREDVVTLGGVIQILDTTSGRFVRSLEGHTAPVTAVAFFPDGTRLLSASDDATVRLWDIDSGRQIRSWTKSGPVRCLALLSDGKLAASAADLSEGRDLRPREVAAWDAETGSVRFRWPLAVPVGIGAGPNQFLVAHGAHALTAYRADSGEVEYQGQFATRLTYMSTTAFAVSPDGRWCASGSLGGDLSLHDGRTGAQVRHAQVHQDLIGSSQSIEHLTFSRSGALLASAGNDGGTCVWRVADGRRLACHYEHSRLKMLLRYAGHYPARSMAFSADERALYLGMGEGRLDRWRLPEDR